MFGRTMFRTGLASAAKRPQLTQQSRNMATVMQLKARIGTVKSIAKITKAMKMVAAAKLRGVQAHLEKVRVFQAGVSDVWPEPSEDNKVPRDKTVLVAITSDRGLCGGVNSVISRHVRDKLNELQASGSELPRVVVFGDKGKAALERLYSKTFDTTITDSGKAKLVTFEQSSLLAELLQQQEYDQLQFIYNKFKSAIAYDTTVEPVYSHAVLEEEREFWKDYNFEGEQREVLEALYEFRLAVRLHHMFMEAATSEQSARMTAMENSSKNAGEMIDKLQLVYNRTRQAKITTELIEIISGAAAAESMT
eukprot:TRINITY_DN8068_c0_g1_i1.p1 TRINITY_DN8068_c0_g1~~TRINITY_DN8068_c0_g1_i1.p1  ORF type:complete len:307 (-),score=186.80 TRINITY_DN8068_c0_g1_i1:178-1098(-)